MLLSAFDKFPLHLNFSFSFNFYFLIDEIVYSHCFLHQSPMEVIIPYEATLLGGNLEIGC